MNSIQKILRAAKLGWISGGIKWKEESCEHGVDPNKFVLELTEKEFKKIMTDYVSYDSTKKTLFWNMLYIKHPEIRLPKSLDKKQDLFIK